MVRGVDETSRSATPTRRRFVGDSVLAVSGAVALSGAGDASRQSGAKEISGYPMFQYDYRNTGHAPGQEGPVSDPVVLWDFAIDGALNAPVPSSLAVDRGRVFVGTEYDDLYAIDAAAGTEEWRFEHDSTLGKLTASGDRLYVGGDDLAVLEAGTGAVVWDESEGTDKPVVLGPDSVLGIGADSLGGENVWILTPWDDDSELKLPGDLVETPAFDGSMLYVVNDDVTVFGVQRDDFGEWEIRWESDPNDVSSTSSPSPPTLKDGTVYVGGGTSTGGAVVAIDAENGNLNWRASTAGEVTQSVACTDEAVYVGDDDGWVYAFDTDDGSMLWRFEALNGGVTLTDGVGTPPIVTDDTVFIGSEDNRAYAIDSENGTERWRFRFNSDVVSLAVASGIVFVGVGGGRVYAITSRETSPITVPEDAPRSVSQGSSPSLGLVAGGILTGIGGIAGLMKLYRSRNPPGSQSESTEQPEIEDDDRMERSSSASNDDDESHTTATTPDSVGTAEDGGSSDREPDSDSTGPARDDETGAFTDAEDR